MEAFECSLGLTNKSSLPDEPHENLWNVIIHIAMVSCQKGPTRHAYAWQLGPFWQDTLDKSNSAVFCSG